MFVSHDEWTYDTPFVSYAEDNYENKVKLHISKIKNMQFVDITDNVDIVKNLEIGIVNYFKKKSLKNCVKKVVHGVGLANYFRGKVKKS